MTNFICCKTVTHDTNALQLDQYIDQSAASLKDDEHFFFVLLWKVWIAFITERNQYSNDPINNFCVHKPTIVFYPFFAYAKMVNSNIHTFRPCSHRRCFTVVTYSGFWVLFKFWVIYEALRLHWYLLATTMF